MFQNLLLTGYELLSALLPFSVFLWVYARHSRKRGAPLSGTELAAMLLFGLYIAAVLYYTGSGLSLICCGTVSRSGPGR